ncbi:regulator of RpoS [Sideroxyarcus emersonii]|uniref:Regulator of RpoS n=1 Tax=Sideroxyarcus emersonii TaxID=2764705 RepID=A0AAN1XAD7_9PROT|nr:EAL domain-containing protein [Sideroxyarcus emersonii]BCK87882.1 regulator of RpoS [Sideroxyarcus emersonii]
MERTLLLVDDEEEIGAALARLLRSDGYTILRASSGIEGLEILAQHEVGVVISDQRMPEMSGVEFLTRVYELYPQTIRIVLSGYADLASVTDAINRGAIYKFFTKPWDNEALRADVQEAFRRYELKRQKEKLLHDIQGANVLLSQINLELAAEMEHKDSQIERIAHYDPLTDLPNRLLFLDRLDQEIARAHRDNQMVAVMSLDLDRFKQVNDSFGHPVGDELLQIVAGRLAGHVRECDTVARIAGDEFGLLLADIKATHYAGEVAQKILDSFAHDPVTIGDSEIYVTLSIGISIYPFDGINTTALLKNAAAALHHAKHEGRNNFQYYAGQMNASAWRRLKLETELRRALEREEFVLHYQPKADLQSGKVVGMEALLRWQSADRGLVAPGEFISVLEETGMILPVGEWVLRTACKQACLWQAAGFPDIHIAVNLSAMQFRQPDFASLVLGIMRESGLEPALGVIELELTETVLMHNSAGTLDTLRKLHEAGMRLSIDDFGTGYSSLSYLKRFPINSLKIDQSFVQDLPVNPDDEAIVAAIIALGRSLGLGLIAEGVETEEQLARLRRMGCNQMQGYLFSRPVPAAEMTYLLQNGGGLDLPLEG